MKRATRIANSQGYNLIEAAIVLGVAGLIVAGIFSAWGAVSSQNRMRRAQDQIMVIVNQIRSTYGNRSQMDNTTDGLAFTNALVNAGLLPDSWISNTTSNALGNPYGGTIVVTPDSMPSSTMKDSMNITLSQVSQKDCYKLASNMVGAARNQGLYKIDSATISTTSTFAQVKNSVCTNATSPNSLRLFFSLKSGT